MTEARRRLADSNEFRAAAVRWVITGEIVLISAAHFGGEEDGPADLTLLRDARKGGPLLPGASLGGALRSYLADVLAGYGTPEPVEVQALFGGGRGLTEGSQSPVVIFDSLGVLPEGFTEEVRDGVSILADLGTAAAHKKYDLEVLPAGTVFPVRVELLVGKSEDESELIKHLVLALEGLTPGEIGLGARRSRGLGNIRSEGWRARRFDLKQAPDWLDWLQTNPETPIGADIIPNTTAQSACAAVGSQWGLAWTGDDLRDRAVVHLRLHVKQGLLVRSSGTTPDAPDAVHLISGGESVLPGTSLAGALRSAALLIAGEVRASRDEKEWVQDLFGPQLEGTRDPNFVPHVSRLRVSEEPVTHGKRRRPSRIRVDRFSGGVMTGGLFDEEPDYGGSVSVRLELREPTEARLGFLLLVLKDLLEEHLALGGGASVGRGVVRGSGSLEIGQHRYELQPGVVTPDDKELDRLVNAFVNAPELTRAARATS